MSNTRQALTVSGAFGRSGRHGARIAEDLGVICAWSLLGLTVSALSIAAGFGTELGQILLIAG